MSVASAEAGTGDFGDAQNLSMQSAHGKKRWIRLVHLKPGA